MFDYKNPFWRKRFIVMLISLIFMGMGIHFFRWSLMGNDPSTALVLAVADHAGMSLSVMLIIVNSTYFVLEIFLGRKLIGSGTFFNWFGVGIIADTWGKIFSVITLPDSFIGRLPVMLIGILILSFSCALYQTADLGISPYDSVSLIMAERLPIPYFWCRIFTDSACAITAYLLGGIIGLGTLVCALGLGPFIAFFTKHVAQPLLTEKAE